MFQEEKLKKNCTERLKV